MTRTAPFKTISVNGVERTIGQWAKIKKIRYDVIWARLNRGWTPAQAVSEERGPNQIVISVPESFAGINPCLVPVMVPDSSRVGAQAQELRWSIGIPIEDVAAALGCSISTAYLLEKGKSTWTMELITKFNGLIHKMVAEKHSSTGAKRD